MAYNVFSLVCGDLIILVSSLALSTNQIFYYSKKKSAFYLNINYHVIGLDLKHDIQ